MRKKAEWYYSESDDDYSIGGDGWSANVWRGESGDSWEWYIYDYEQGERISDDYFGSAEEAKADCELEIADMGLVEASRKRRASLGTWREEYDGTFFKNLQSRSFGEVQCAVMRWDDKWYWSIDSVDFGEDVFDPGLYEGFVDTAEQGKAKCDMLLDELDAEFADAGGFFAKRHVMRISRAIL